MHPPKPKLIRVYFLTTLKDPSAYVAGLREAVAERAPDRFEIVYPVPADLDRSSVHAVVTADPVPGDLATFPNLRLILNLWAGVDGLLADPLFPKNPATTLLRMVDPSITTTMSLSVVSHVLNIHSGTYTYLAQQRNALWLPFPDGPPRLPKDRTVAGLGCGELGAAAVAALHALGFAVVAWSRSPKPSLESHYLRTSSSSPPPPRFLHGQPGLATALSLADIVVNLLPATPSTAGLLSARTLRLLRPSAALVNLGRGQTTVESDLLDALDRRALAFAVLDVFEVEPLPRDSPLWCHPRCAVFPHVAAAPGVRSAADAVVGNLWRFFVEEGRGLVGVVDLARGY